MPNVALLPVPRQQFSDINGVPLAGGFVYTYAAGTTTPLATYVDGLGVTPNANPVVLDSGGFASIWLTAATYKIVVTDLNGVQQWTQDNVSAVSQAELTGNSSFTSLSVTGSINVGGSATVSGILSGASVSVSGAATVGGNLTAANATVTGNLSAGATTVTSLTNSGNETVDGTLSVSGAASVLSLAINGVDSATVINNLIAAAASLSGNLVLSAVGAVSGLGGNWYVFTFGTVSGTRWQIAIGSGLGTNGSTVTLPSGFTTSQSIVNVAVNGASAVSGNLENFSCSIASNVITCTGSDSTGHTPTMTVLWTGIAWRSGY